jgi:hypothetical protein
VFKSQNSSLKEELLSKLHLLRMYSTVTANQRAKQLAQDQL